MMRVVLLVCALAACGGGAKPADAGRVDDGGVDSPADSSAQEVGGQCCTVTRGGPGTEDCPCNPNRSIPSSCRNVGRTCTYQACDIAVSCECRASEDGGPSAWSCQFLIR
jgi:hypothetical protein